MPLPSLLLRRPRQWLVVMLALAGVLRAAAGTDGDAPVGWWRDAVFYEIFVRSFADARSGPLANDGIGDFQGLIDKLDYLNDGRGPAGKSLGVTALWLMPIHPSPSYHGYDVTDYFAVNPEFGDLALFKRFLAEAHRRGIRVIIDFVPNHASSQHPLFQQALKEAHNGDTRKLFRFADVPPELFGPWDQRAWHPAGSPEHGFYYGVFSSEMPDWNFRDPRVTEHHRRAAEFWLKEVGVDGLRLDAVRYLLETGEQLQDTAETREWLRQFTEFCHTVKPAAFIIGENTARMPEVARAIRGGALDSAFEFDLARATVEAVRLHTPGILTQALARLDTLYAGESPWATLLTNHDQERARTQLDGSEALTRLATKVLFTLPGVPFLYYGEELGMQAAKPDPELRTPMPWTGESPNAGFAAAGVHAWKAPKPDYPRINVAAESDAPDSLLNLYRRLIRLNESSAALRHGRPLPIATDSAGIYAQMRETADEVVVVLGNFSGNPVPGPKLRVERSAMRSGWRLSEVLEGATVAAPEINSMGGFEHWQPMPELAAQSVYVLRWQR